MQEQNKQQVMLPENPKKQCTPRLNKKQPSIFDGMITKQVSLARVSPTKTIKAQNVFLQTDIDSKLNALKYRFPLNFLGSPYKQIVMPCTPAYELSVFQSSQQQKHQYSYSFAKVSGQSEVHGIASGKRSAILYGQGEKLIRLKGCGNQNKGFNRQNNESRGHHFYHTAKRELYITNKINQIFKNELKIDPPANKPLYAYNFSDQAIKKLNLSNDLPMISKYCCVFETRGDRRAGTHLISPLEVLFLTIMDHSKAEWKDLFTSKNRIDLGQIVQFVTNFELMVSQGQKFIQIYDASKEIENYIGISEGKLTLIENYQQNIAALISKLIPPNEAENTLELVKKINFNKFIETCETILCRIGYQMGQIKRSMCVNEISWGFYLDHGVEWHCNAHLNNFIITNPQSSKQTTNYFLLPLDYDLSYSFKQFICIDLDSPHYGQSSQDVFQNYLCGEFSAMEMSLFGLQMMNFKYGIGTINYSKDEVKMSKVAFRDTLVRAFNAGMRNKEEVKTNYIKRWDENIEDIHNLVQLCLWLSIDFQT